ncbi:IclR family transcriptional regulator [Thalassovita mangrovi]|uniref:Helix-turn-helix domain-containing protein n=1 Tax=Thalassovita mangrovi TaxID=2692236 RepID=A0A6L8LLG5_9RHOB|nr:IclR family transcriptional regulator [Thalassovita mangrovi]MYM56824.1 helix-turn-helix domain-containing protein [Thalassovita mangrovi]
MLRNTLRAESGVPFLSSEQRADPLFINSIARAMQVLAAFHDADRPLSLSDIAERAGVDRSGAQRIVHTLRSLGYIQRDAEDRGFLPGIRIMDHTLDYLRLNPLIQRATPVLLELRRNVQERVDLSLFDGQRVVYAARMQSKRESFYATLVGHSVPTFSSSGGWAIMARLSDEEAMDIIENSDRSPFTPRTLTDPGEIIEEVRRTRARGYSLAVEQILLGEVAIGVAITNPQGRPLGAIHVAGSLSEWTPEEFSTRMAPLALEAARAINHY